MSEFTKILRAKITAVYFLGGFALLFFLAAGFQFWKAQELNPELMSLVRGEAAFAMTGILSALGMIGLGYSIARDLRKAWSNEVRFRTLTEKAERDIRESEQRLQLFDDITQEAIIIHDQGIIVEANRAFAQHLGYDRREILGRHIAGFMDQESTKEAQDRIEKGYPDGSYEILAKRKDGSTFPLLVHGQDFEFHGRKMRASSGWDISQVKNAERALMESESRFKRFAEISTEGIYIGSGGKIIDLNTTLARMMGYEVQELIGTDPLSYATPETVESAREHVLNRYDGAYEVVLRRKDGSTFPAEIHGRAFTLQGVPYRVTSVWDISERKKGEEALRQSEENFRALIEYSPDAILVHWGGKIAYVNRKGVELLGFSKPEDVLGQSPFDRVHPDDHEEVEKRIQLTLQGGENPVSEIRMLRKDQSAVLVETLSIGIRFRGQPATMVILRDIAERKKAEDALRRSEAKFRSLIDNSYDLITVVDREGRRIYESPSLERVLGYKPGERRGVTFDTQPPEDQEKAQALFKTVLANPGLPIQAQLKARRKDGRMIEADMVLTNLLENPAVGGIVINARDVTDQKRAEVALRQSEAKFRSMIENSHDLITIVDANGNRIYESPTISKVLGYEVGERQGNAFEYQAPEDLEENRRLFTEVLAHPGVPYKTETKFRHKEGHFIRAEVVLTNLLDDPAVKGIVVNSRDVTDKLKAQEALRHSEEYFRNLIENSNDVISLVEADMKTRYVSPSLKKVMGYESEERAGKSFLDLIHPEDRPVVVKRFAKFMAQHGATDTLEVRALHKNGTYRHVEAIATNLLHHPVMKAIIFNYRDVTERKQAEQTLMKFERLSAIGQMAAGMAHEIRNPLSAISTAGQILKRREEKTGEKGFGEMIVENSERLERLIQDTLGYARSEKTVPQEAFPLTPLLESAARLTQIQFGPSHKTIKVEWKLPPDPLTVFAPPQRIQQIMMNLILNAYQSMAPGGTLTLELKKEGDWALIRVRDTGPGIKDVDMARLFEPFFTTKETGSGLGLALSQRIAKECGGEIKAENGTPTGSIFTLWLPLSKEIKV